MHHTAMHREAWRHMMLACMVRLGAPEQQLDCFDRTSKAVTDCCEAQQHKAAHKSGSEGYEPRSVFPTPLGLRSLLHAAAGD